MLSFAAMFSLLRLSFLGAASSAGLLVLRFVIGAIFAAHGAQKMLGWFGGPGFAATAKGFERMGFDPPLFWAALAGGTELVGGAALLVGFATRWAALGLATVMSVAILRVHWDGGFFLPAGIEHCLALWGGCVALLFAGPGKVSADALLFGGE